MNQAHVGYIDGQGTAPCEFNRFFGSLLDAAILLESDDYSDSPRLYRMNGFIDNCASFTPVLDERTLGKTFSERGLFIL
ncbi:hypothetical protein N9R79_08675 [Vibrio sp.]|nr:hypothetical protein [Vibrio sp.]